LPAYAGGIDERFIGVDHGIRFKADFSFKVDAG
jgi:hypothetical protein